MCGRYQFTAEQCAELQEIVQAVQRRCGRDAWTPGEIRPSLKAPVLVERQGSVEADLMRWGFQTQKSLIINARSESAEEKPLFRDSVQMRRCVIPPAAFISGAQISESTCSDCLTRRRSIWRVSTSSGRMSAATAF